jgi:hypothetical protein
VGLVPAQAAQVSVPLQPVPITQLDTRQASPDLDARRFSLVFEKPVPLRDILLLLVRDTSLSLVPDPGPALDRPMLADLKSVTVRQALEAILEPAGLDFAVRGRLLRVFPRELGTRIFEVDYVAAGSVDVLTDLRDGVSALLSADGRLHLDRGASLLTVTDRPSRLDRIEGYLQTALRHATRQIQLETVAVEVEVPDGARAGVDWRRLLQRLPPTVTDGGTTGVSWLHTLTFPGASVQPMLDALSEQGRVRVVASPRVIAMNNQPAVVRIEARQGLSLTVTPQIASTGIVHLSVHPRVTAQLNADAASASNQPVLQVSEVDTLVRIRQGQTVVFSGLLRDNGAVPSVGAQGSRTELVILLTPVVVSPGVGTAPVGTP